MKINFMPKTRSGKWAVGFAIASAVLTALSLLFAFVIGGDSAVIADNFLLTILANTLSIMFSFAGPLSFFIGIYTIIKHNERSIWKPLAVLYVLTLIMFLLGEFLFPH